MSNGLLGGEGSSENPYEISSCIELQGMKLDLSAHYVLNNSINCLETNSWNKDTHLRFYGDNEHVRIDDDEVLRINESLTISIWVNIVNDTQSPQAIIAKDYVYGEYYIEFRFTADLHRILFFHGNRDGGNNLESKSFNPDGIYGTKWDLNEWYHFTFIRDMPEKRIYVYQDGVQIGNQTFDFDIIGGNTAPVLIGTNTLSFQRTFNGSLDDVRLFDRIISEKEIEELSLARNRELGDEVAHWKFNEGSGTNAEDSVNGNNGTLTNNPTWEGTNVIQGFEPIGDSTNPFEGTFNGENHTVNNLFINRPTTDYIGLIGYTEYDVYDVWIRNLKLTNVNITGRNFVGALGGLIGGYDKTEYIEISGSIKGNTDVGGMTGYHRRGNPENIIADVNIEASGSNVGGIAGRIWGNTMYYSISEGKVEGNNVVGGLVGDDRGSIRYSSSNANVVGNNRVGGIAGSKTGTGWVYVSYATGNVTGNDYVGGGYGLYRPWGTHLSHQSYSTGTVEGNYYVGGWAGGIDLDDRANVRIRNVYSTSDVKGNEHVAGFVGKQYETTEITNCYSIGKVESDNSSIQYIGGFLADSNQELTLSNSYWDNQTSGQSSSEGGTGKTTAEMKSGIPSAEIYNNWDYSIWNFRTESDYPVLQWQNINVAPEILEIEINDGVETISLIPAGNKTVNCKIVLRDHNGYEDINIDNLYAKFYYDYYDESIVDEEFQNINYAFYNDTPATIGYDFINMNVTFSFELPYHAAKGDWECFVYIEDESAESDTSKLNIEINEMLSFSVSSNLNFGSTLPGSHTDEVSYPVNNYGNSLLNLELSGTGMDCEIGEIKIENIRYSFFENIDFNEKSNIETEEVELNLNIGKKTQELWSKLSSRNLYWQVLPEEGVKGTCSGTIQLTATEGEYDFTENTNFANGIAAFYSQNPTTGMYYELTSIYVSSSRYDIGFRNSSDGDTWSSLNRIVENEGMASMSELRVLENGELALVVSKLSGFNYNLFLYTSNDGGINWNTSQITSSGVNIYPSFEITSEGDLHLVYSTTLGLNPRDVYYIKSIDDGKTWNSLTIIAAGGDYPRITADSEDNLYLSYSLGSDGTAPIRFRKYNGTWTTIDLPLIETEKEPYLINDIDDTLWMVFVNDNNPYYIRSFDSGVTWDVPRKLSTNNVLNPTIGVMNNGNLWFAYHDGALNINRILAE